MELSDLQVDRYYILDNPDLRGVLEPMVVNYRGSCVPSIAMPPTYTAVVYYPKTGSQFPIDPAWLSPLRHVNED